MSTSHEITAADGAIPVARFLTTESVPSSGSFSSETVAGARATLQRLYGPHNRRTEGTLGPLLLPDVIILVPTHDKFSRRQDPLRVPPLTLLANAAAASLACGSILAGQSSESDEFGDVGFWLGPGPYTHDASDDGARALLRALGTTHTGTDKVRLRHVVLPGTCVLIPQALAAPAD